MKKKSDPSEIPKKSNLSTNLTLEQRVKRLEKQVRINTRIMKSQWDIRQEVGKLENRVEKLEIDAFKKLDLMERKFESFFCYKRS